MNHNDMERPIIYNKPLQKEDFIEWMNEMVRKRIKIPFTVVLIFTALFYILFLVLTILGMRTVSIWYVILVSICFITALFFQYGMPRILGQLRYNQYCFTRSNVNRTIVFFEDYLELKVGNEQITSLPYGNIRKTAFTEHLYVMAFPNYVQCIVRQDGFSENDFNIIQERINEKTKNGDK